MAYFFKCMLKHFQTFAVPNQGVTEVYVQKIRALEEELSLARLRHHFQRQTIWPRTYVPWLLEFCGHWIRYTGHYRTMHVFMFSGREDGLVKSFCLMVLPIGVGAGLTVGTWKYVWIAHRSSWIGFGRPLSHLIDWWLIAWALRMSINVTEEKCFFMWLLSCVIVFGIVWIATIWEEQALGVLVAACFCELNTSQDFASERRERQVEINEDPFSNHDLQMFFFPT